MRKIIIIAFAVSLLSLIAFDAWMRRPSVSGSVYHGRIKSGEHAGRYGRVVSIPSLANLYNSRVTLNVEATEQEIRERYEQPDYAEYLVEEMRNGRGPRQWITEWSSNVELTEL